MAGDLEQRCNFRLWELQLTDTTFISVNVARAASISGGAVTVEHATDGVGVTLRAPPTGITDTSIVKVAQQSCQEQEIVKKKNS